MLTGENGLLTKATESKTRNEEGEIKEEIGLAWNAVQTDGIVEGWSLDKKAEELKTVLEKNGSTASVKVGGSNVNVTYRGYQATINTLGGGITEFAKATPKDPNVKITVADAKSSNKIFDGTEEPLVDNYGNEIIVPKGFKIVEGTNVTDGIVIQDESAKDEISKGNQFVWIPVGDVYTTADEKKTSENTKTIPLDRYCFEDKTSAKTGTPTSWSKLADNGGYHAYFSPQYAEETTARINKSGKNATAKNLSGFLSGATKGFYIGRYEARVQGYTDFSTSKSSDDENWTGYTGGTLVSKKDEQVYNWITQNKVAEVSRTMYSSLGKFESDLINSYAWDTATLFLQEFGETNYSIKSSMNTSSDGLANMGTTSDHPCNVYDMASNCNEWTTETHVSSSSCVTRGSYCYDNNSYASIRGYRNTIYFLDGNSFRPILYVK